jgi:hypothetical protein
MRNTHALSGDQSQGVVRVVTTVVGVAMVVVVVVEVRVVTMVEMEGI